MINDHLITSFALLQVRRTYDVTPFAYSFVSSRVREIQNPSLRNPTWDKGLWVEFTALFDKTQAPDDFAAWRNLVDTCKRSFNYSLGGTELYINEYQLPFACYKSKCHALADCINDRCVCGPLTEDINPANPGHDCRGIYQTCHLQANIDIIYFILQWTFWITMLYNTKHKKDSLHKIKIQTFS